MEKEYNISKMGHIMKVIGRMIQQTGMEGLFIKMGIYMKVNGKMIRHIAMVHTIIKMVQNSWEIGLRINSMVTEQKNGQMGQSMKGSIIWEKSKGEENLLGLMDQFMMVNFTIIIFMELAYICGMMAENSAVNYQIIK